MAEPTLKQKMAIVHRTYREPLATLDGMPASVYGAMSPIAFIQTNDSRYSIPIVWTKAIQIITDGGKFTTADADYHKLAEIEGRFRKNPKK